MAALIRYRWHGNIRELQNLIERAVILSRGIVLEIPLAELKHSQPLADQVHTPTTLEAPSRAGAHSKSIARVEQGDWRYYRHRCAPRSKSDNSEQQNKEGWHRTGAARIAMTSASRGAVYRRSFETPDQM